jgi:uncharacterized protein YbaP (TraB family)
MHLLRAADAQLSGALDHAYADAKRLVMEVDTDDLDEAAIAQWTLLHGSYPADSHQTLRSVLGEERWQRVNQETEKTGLPLAAVDTLKPWLVGVTYSVLQLQQLGLDPKLGVEQQLTTRARQDHKPITGLETVEQQLSLFDDLPLPLQLRFLDLTIEETKDAQQEVDELTNAWKSGDERKLAASLLNEYARFPELYDMLVSRRNLAWIPQIEALLQGHEDYLVVVGALHLVGDRGVIHLLQQDGLKPQRVLH